MKNKGMKRFGELLRHYRESKGLHQADLAERCGLSVSFISYLERGRRRPAREKVLAIANALNLPEEPRRNLLVEAGYPLTAESVDTSIGASVLPMLSIENLSEGQRDAFLRDLQRVARRYRRPGGDQVRTAVIPIAGWEPEFFAPQTITKILDPAIGEAVEAGIEDIVLIVRAGQAYPKPEAAARTFYIHQEEKRGLGHAVLLSREAVRAEPFALILPDDIIITRSPRAACTKQMKEAYAACRSTVIAVMGDEANQDPTHSGFVTLDEARIGGRELYEIRDIVEKPKTLPEGPKWWAIAGRYILSPAIFDVLERTPADREGEVQLTDGLRLLQMQEPLYGYRFEGESYRLAPIKASLKELERATGLAVDGLSHQCGYAEWLDRMGEISRKLAAISYDGASMRTYLYELLARIPTVSLSLVSDRSRPPLPFHFHFWGYVFAKMAILIRLLKELVDRAEGPGAHRVALENAVKTIGAAVKEHIDALLAALRAQEMERCSEVLYALLCSVIDRWHPVLLLLPQMRQPPKDLKAIVDHHASLYTLSLTSLSGLWGEGGEGRRP